MASTTMKKTSTPGLYVRADGRFTLRATAVSQQTKALSQKMETLPPGTTKGDALKRLLELKDELRAGDQQPSPETPPTTLADYSESWLARRIQRVRPSVARNYKDNLARYVLPHLGHLTVSEIHRGHIESWVAWAEKVMRADGTDYSSATVNVWWRVATMVIRDAVAELGLAQDPTARVRAPRRRSTPKRERRTLSREQLRALLDAVRQFFPGRYAEIATLAFTGMRAGELYALHWSDVDFEERVLHIRRAVWRGTENDTKTGDPRSVPLSETLVQVLREQHERLKSVEHPGLKADLVFPADNGEHRFTSALTKPLELAAEHAKVGIHVSPQVLRRTWNTLLVLAGADRIVLRSMLGHVSEAMTRRYAGIGLDAKHAAVELLAVEG